MKTLSSIRIEEGLKRCQMKPIDLAKAAGIGRASLSQYINGMHTPNTKNASKIAKILGGNPLWYMGFEDVPFSYEKQEQIISGIRHFTEEELQAVLNLVNFIKENKDEKTN